jgi:hypothetical protein
MTKFGGGTGSSQPSIRYQSHSEFLQALCGGATGSKESLSLLYRQNFNHGSPIRDFPNFYIHDFNSPEYLRCYVQNFPRL